MCDIGNKGVAQEDLRALHRRQHSGGTNKSHNSSMSNMSETGRSQRSGGTNTTNKSGTKRFVHKQPQANRRKVNNHFKDPNFRYVQHIRSVFLL